MKMFAFILTELFKKMIEYDIRIVQSVAYEGTRVSG